MSSRPPCVLIADGTPASRTLLEPPLRRAGWHVVTVSSSFEVLRAVRDHDVSVVLIDPELPGTGVSGIDVVRTLKSAPRFREVPVFFLLRGGQEPPAGLRVEGTVDLDPRSADTLPERMRGLLRLDDDVDGVTREATARAAAAMLGQYGTDEVRAAVDRIVREVAREVVPEVAERLIREEIRRLRREHGFEERPS